MYNLQKNGFVHLKNGGVYINNLYSKAATN